MRLLLLFCFSLFLVLPSQAQERVRNIRIRVVDSAKLEIRYDLINTKSGDSVYIEMRSRLRGALRILPEFVQGDWGINITAGSDRRILWDALANGYSLNEEVQAKVLVKTGTASAASQIASQPVTTTPVVSQPPIVTTSKPEAVPPKPTSTKPVTIVESTPKISEPAAVTLTPSRSRKTKRNQQTKPSIFAADTVQAEPVTTTPVAPTPVASTPVPQSPASLTVPAVKKAEPSQPIVVQQTEPSSATVVVDTVRRTKTRYAGPAWALLSAVAPGIGNIFVQTPKPKVGLRPLLTVACYGLVAYGLMERKKSQDDYAIYEQQKNMTEGEPYYKTANDHNHMYFMATRGAALVAAADVVLTFIKGLRNNQIQKEARRIQGVTLRPGLQAGQPTAVVRYSF